MNGRHWRRYACTAESVRAQRPRNRAIQRKGDFTPHPAALSSPVISKLRINRPLILADLAELEQMLMRAGIGAAQDLSHAKEISEGLGLFLRSLIGLDRGAAKAAFDTFLESKTPTANQIEFINVIIDHLTDQGFMDPGLLYASPFIDFNPKGVDGLFTADQVTAIFTILDGVRQTAVA